MLKSRDLLSVSVAAALALGGPTGMPAGAADDDARESEGRVLLTAEPLGLGRAARADEIAAWDVDVLPNGRGLPPGKGDAFTGEEIFAEHCASCHGDFAEGVDNWPALAGGQDTLADRDPVKTVGSYWPHLSTVWDYVNRSMPFGTAQTLSADDVYGIVAYILYSNDMVDEEFELSHENFLEIAMHNADGFIADDRSVSEYPLLRVEPCMTNCKESAEITMRASVLDVTPETETSEGEPAVPADDTAAVETAAMDPELFMAGERVFRKCRACHQVGEGAVNRSGPQLNALFGRTMGGLDGFRYSKAFRSAADEGRIWDEAGLAEFLKKPKSFIKGTKMVFAGLKSDADIEAVIAYLKAEGM